MINHHQKQREEIEEIEKLANTDSVSYSVVAPVPDFDNDTRICLTSVHFPKNTFFDKIQSEIIDPLREVQPAHYYYDSESLHMTIKNIRVVNDPPNFTEETVEKAKKIFSDVIPRHKAFSVTFYRLVLFPNNLALAGTSDIELTRITNVLDREMTKAAISDDKKYLKPHSHFITMTLARFYTPPDNTFKRKVRNLSGSFQELKHIVDSVSLLTCTAVCKNRHVIGSWRLF